MNIVAGARPNIARVSARVGPGLARGGSRLMQLMQMHQSESHISEIVSKINKINVFNVLSAQ